jgi:hypothetical protein
VLSVSFKVRNNEVGLCKGARHATIGKKLSGIEGSIGVAEHKPASGKVKLPGGTTNGLRFASL